MEIADKTFTKLSTPSNLRTHQRQNFVRKSYIEIRTQAHETILFGRWTEWNKATTHPYLRFMRLLEHNEKRQYNGSKHKRSTYSEALT